VERTHRIRAVASGEGTRAKLTGPKQSWAEGERCSYTTFLTTNAIMIVRSAPDRSDVAPSPTSAADTAASGYRFRAEAPPHKGSRVGTCDQGKRQNASMRVQMQTYAFCIGAMERSASGWSPLPKAFLGFHVHVCAGNRSGFSKVSQEERPWSKWSLMTGE